MPEITKDNQVHANISKLYDVEGNAKIPSAYRMNTCDLVKANGDVVPFGEIVTSISIVEELFSPVIMCTIRIRDKINFFEDNQLDGQERVRLEIDIISNLNDSEPISSLTVEFFVKEYPDLVKTGRNMYIQEYTIVAMSSFAYISQLTRMSIGVPRPGNTGDPIKEISDIFEKQLLFTPKTIGDASELIADTYGKVTSKVTDLLDKFGFSGLSNSLSTAFDNLATSAQGVANNFISAYAGSNRPPNYVFVDTKYESLSKFKGNITFRSPLAAIDFLRTKAYDENLSPFFVYNRIGPGAGLGNSTGDTVIVQSLSSIVEGTIYKPTSDGLPYKFSPGIVHDDDPSKAADLQKYYDEQRKRILKVESNLKINKLQQASSGVFGNTTWIYDYVQKDYIGKQYDPYAELEDILEELQPPEVPVKPFQGMMYGDPEEGIIDLGNNEKITKHIQRDLHLPPPQNETDAAQGIYTAPEIYANVLNKAKYYYSRLQDDTSHEIQVYGDFNLNPGVKINLAFPKAVTIEADGEGASDEEDTKLSGTFLTTIATHSFAEGMYKTQLKVVKLTKKEF